MAEEKASMIMDGSALKGWSTEYVMREVLLGVTVCFAQIPESVAFAFMAHIKPPIALHAAWVVGFTCSAFGGRPGMVNGATGAFAAIIGTFITNGGTGKNGEGVERLFPSVMLAGVFMILVSWLKLSRFITMLPAPVMIGFCNGLAIVIGLAQLHPFKDADTHEWKGGDELLWMLVICLSSMLIMELLPQVPLKIFKVVPSSLMAILSAVLLEFLVVRVLFESRTDTIGDVSEFTLDTAFPIPFFVNTDAVSYELQHIYEGDGIATVFIQGFLLCTVGTIESLMTSEVVESFVKTPSNHDRTVLAMGVGNIISGFLGGMGGNAMIGLSTVNCLNGGRGRLGPIVAAAGIAICCMGAFPLLNFIPVAALAGVMIVVVLHTFKWFSLTMLVAAILPKKWRESLNIHRKVPRIEVAVIVIVTVLANATNIAYAVGGGVAICSMAFAWQSARNLDVTVTEDGDVKRYHVGGPLYFVTANKFKKMLNPDTDPDNVEVWFQQTKLMDYSAMGIVHELSVAYEAKGKKLKFHSVDPESEKLLVKANHLVKQVSYELESGIFEDPKVPTIMSEFSKDPANMTRQLSGGHKEAGSTWDEAACQTSMTADHSFSPNGHGTSSKTGGFASMFKRSFSLGGRKKWADSAAGSSDAIDNWSPSAHDAHNGDGSHHDATTGLDTLGEDHKSVHSVGGVVIEGLDGRHATGSTGDGDESPETATPPDDKSESAVTTPQGEQHQSTPAAKTEGTLLGSYLLPTSCFPSSQHELALKARPRPPQCWRGLSQGQGSALRPRSCFACPAALAAPAAGAQGPALRPRSCFAGPAALAAPAAGAAAAAAATPIAAAPPSKEPVQVGASIMDEDVD